MTARTPFRTLSGVLLALSLFPARAAAHCDTMDGPVVQDAQRALASGDPGVVLKWVKPESGVEVREAFRHALSVRALGPEAKALADRFFLETVVRIHRQGEGAPYTGVRPAGAEIEPAVAAADQALQTGSVDALVEMVTAAAERGLRHSFEDAFQARARMGESLERGREYVAAYVRFTHYAERVHGAAAAGGADDHAAASTPHAGHR